MNPVEIDDAVSTLAQQPFDAGEFPFEFLRAFGNSETTIKRLRSGSTNQSDVPGAVLQRSNIHIATCPIGEVDATLRALRASPKTISAKARFILATDGEAFQAEDMTSGETVVCAYPRFPDHFGFFLPLAGITTVQQVRESSFDIKATGRLNRLYVQLLTDNPEWRTVERRTDMNHFMARLIFCFFAEDTDIFRGEGLFTSTVEEMTARDASDTHVILSEVFRSMDTKPEDREAANVPRYANRFPYVNGQLFSGSTETPRFSKIARSYLLHIGGLNWRKINPDIFGSMIQAVADDEERGALGMHYTSVPNILKVLNPLFLDDLRDKLDEASDNGRKLLNLRNRMARIRVFDPACGSGNFLVIAYKEMRAIEAEVNRRRGEPDRRSDIPLTNFRGIELRDFPAEIARLALIIAEYQADVLYRGQQEALAEFLPLDSQNWITCGNALRLDWLSICPSTGTGVKIRADDLFETPLDQSEIDFSNAGGETYICGNPPYLGAKKKSPDQVDDMERVGLGKAKLLDYVAAFVVKGLDYMDRANADMALVSTSSICQGEQVALLWPRVFERATIKFAYRPFRWANSASRNAGVWCTIVGLSRISASTRLLFDGGIRRECQQISPYLIPGSEIIVHPRSKALSSLHPMTMGSNPVDGKRLILEPDDYRSLVREHPASEAFLKSYGGTQELLSNERRFCVWIDDDYVSEAQQIPALQAIIEDCREYRQGAGRDAKKAAKRPHAFCYSTYQDSPFLYVGNTIGSDIDFVPISLSERGHVISHAAFAVYGIRLVEFSLIASTLHKVWAETISGKLGNGIRYGNTVVYNTFPVPPLTTENRVQLERCATQIMVARETYFPANINELYDASRMEVEFPDLYHAHKRNDEVIERIYIGRQFRNDTERLEKLFDLYTKMTTKKAA